MSPLPYIALLLVLTAVFLTLVISALRATCPRPAAQAHPLSAIIRHSPPTSVGTPRAWHSSGSSG